DLEAPGPRRLELQMVLRHRRRHDQRTNAVDVGRIMATNDIDAELAQILDAHGIGIAATHLHAAADEQFGERAHASAGDSYEVDGTLIGRIEKHVPNLSFRE